MPNDLIPDPVEVQPVEGQGIPAVPAQDGTAFSGQGQSSDTGLYDLSSVPEEYRSEVERIAKDIDRNVQKKLQEHSEYRKGWEPYESLGLRDYDADSVSSLLNLAQALSDEDSAREVVTRLADSLGMSFDSQGEADDDGDPDPLAELRSEIQELREFKSQFDLNREQEAQIAALETEYAEVEGMHGRAFSEDEKDQLMTLAAKFAAEDFPIKAAYEVINQIAGKAETSLFSRKVKEPAPAEVGGRASTTPKPVESFEDAERLFIESRRG